MPHEPVSVSPFRRGVCWYGLRAKAKGQLSAQRYCGAGGDYYKVDSKRINPMDPAYTIKVFMWLCYKHVQEMEKRGYVVTKVLDRTAMNLPESIEKQDLTTYTFDGHNIHVK